MELYRQDCPVLSKYAKTGRYYQYLLNFDLINLNDFFRSLGKYHLHVHLTCILITV